MGIGSKTLLQASYQVGYLCKNKPHTITEELIKPRKLETAKNVPGLSPTCAGK